MTSPSRDPDPNGWTSPFEELLDRPAPATTGGFGAAAHTPDLTFGTPGEDTAFWEGQQQLDDDCAIKCQQFILEQFTGRTVEEFSLVREAWEHGWYAPGQGTSPENVGNLLELHGLGVTRYQHASQFHLADELAHGHKVIVGVESEALWNHNPLLETLREMLGIPTADHAVVVSGIDTSDPQHVLVQVSDPGTGQALATYPMEQFLEAWRGSDFFMVATQDPAPANLPEMAHFNYGAGHIADVAGLPFDQFLEFADHPSTFADVVHEYAGHDAADEPTLDDLAPPEEDAEHAGSLDPVEWVFEDNYDDPVMDPYHHDASHGDSDIASNLPDEPTHPDLS